MSTTIPPSINIASPSATTEECLQIRKALLLLWDIDDRSRWQTALCVLLFDQANEAGDYDAHEDPRLDNIIAGFNLFFRFFEVRADLSFRHQPDRFDQAGFCSLSGPWAYPDDWWSTVAEDDIRLVSAILINAGILEYKYRETGNSTADVATCLRLRADRIVDLLMNLQMEACDHPGNPRLYALKPSCIES